MRRSWKLNIVVLGLSAGGATCGCRAVIGIDDKHYVPVPHPGAERDAGPDDSGKRSEPRDGSSIRTHSPDANASDSGADAATKNDGGVTEPSSVADVAVWEGGTSLGFGVPRTGVAFAFSGRAKKLMSFGGQVNYGANISTDAALFWSGLGVGWSAIPSSGSKPSPRTDVGAAEIGQDVLFYGGALGVGGLPAAFSDTWKFDGSTWTQICAEGECGISIPLRAPAMAGLPNGTAILFGGETGDVASSSDPWVRTAFENDTYRFDGSTWQKLSPTFAPGPIAGRSFAHLAGDAARGRFVLFGGTGAKGGTTSYLDDTWEFDPVANGGQGSWSCICGCFSGEPCGPHARILAPLAYDSTRQRVLLFGGFSSGPSLTSDYSDTWEWHPELGSWKPFCGTTGSPACDTGLTFSGQYAQLLREDPGFAFDPVSNRAVMGGGYYLGNLSDTFEFHVRGGACTTDADCDTGHCLGGSAATCCESAACGTGESCARPGSEGVCSK